MSIGHVGLTQSYLFEYAKELFEEITGSQVLDPTLALTSNPTN